MVFFFALGIAVLAALGANVLLRRPSLLAAALAITFLDLLLAGSGTVMNATSVDAEPGITYTQFAGSNDLVNWIRPQRLNQSSPPARFDLYNDFTGWVTTATITELPTANGNDPFALYRLMQVRLLFCKGYCWGRFYQVSNLDSPILDLLNVRSLLSITPVPENITSSGMPAASIFSRKSSTSRWPSSCSPNSF